MNVLVTGGLGFIGSHLVDQLIQNGFQVFIVDNLSSGSLQNLNSKAKFYHVDILDIEKMKLIFEDVKPVAVFHMAAQIDVQTSIIEPSFDAQNNIIGTINILECCKNYKSKLIYSSSAAVYGTPSYLPVNEKHTPQPLSNYGISKFTPELYIQCYAKLYYLHYTILRYANVYGPRQVAHGEGGVISIFIDKMIQGKSPTIYGDGTQTRDFIYVEDIVSANLAALELGKNKIYNISTNNQISVTNLFHLMKQILNTEIIPIFKTERLGDIKNSCLDNTLAKAELKWHSKFSITEGLIKTCQYFESNNR